ncbi:MAG: hypothetical protein A2Z20_05475 [Bdellovibrionales bacterium RBG_16_40_8]|nr:MAG: hypothetical protein A2Z20_05475 [Bdellovibrionales bacterium RBG_16_40_8]
MKNSRGQMTVELVLMMVVTVSIGVGISKFMNDNRVVRNLVEGPWDSLAGMIQNGVWGGTNDDHPNNFDRVGSVKGAVF